MPSYYPSQSEGGMNPAEQEKMESIKRNAARMTGTMANKGRCPKCTLKPPCKHYDSISAL